MQTGNRLGSHNRYVFEDIKPTSAVRKGKGMRDCIKATALYGILAREWVLLVTVKGKQFP